MQNWLKVTLVALLAAGLAACSARQEETGLEAGETGVSVQVENQSFNDMTIYVYERGTRRRLGMVPGLATRNFQIPERMIFGITALRFEADPIGTNQPSISDEIAVSPGEALRLIIPPQ